MNNKKILAYTLGSDNMINNKTNFSRLLVALALFSSSFAVYAEEKIVTEDDVNKAIERVEARINKMLVIEDVFPRLTRVALDYSKINSYIVDNRSTDLFGRPFANGDSDSTVVRSSANIQLSKNFSAGLSLSTVDATSDIDQGTVPDPTNTLHSRSDATGYALSLRYQINDWLAAGAFVGYSDGKGKSRDKMNPVNSGKYTFTGSGEGVYLSATHALTDKIIYSVSPSYTHNKSKSKTYSDAAGSGVLRSDYTLTMLHIDQNLSYFFDQNRARVTGGYTHHIVGHETDTTSIARQTSSGTVYIGGSYLLSVKNGVEIYGVATQDLGDDVYDDTDSFTIGIAKNF